VLGPKIAETPPEFLFFSGGGGTVRGQDYQSLGVELPAGRVGGRSFVGLSAELRQSLGGNLGLAVFADYGYVADGSDFAGGDDHAGVGIGARYITGLGALRVDLGTQATGDTASDLFLYIGLGEAF
jgi:translocation and assembly module TamA